MDKNSGVPVNPHAALPVTFGAMLSGLYLNHQLIGQMTKREVIGRYKGSIFGLAWSLFNPIFMLFIYTFVFSIVFKSRWHSAGNGESKTEFAVVLFVGLIVLNFVNEVLNRAPGLIISNVNYVKKVVFPIEVLSVVSICAALFHALVSLCVLLCAMFFFNGYLPWTTILIPFVFFPLVILFIGFSWILAALGVFLRDVGQSIGLVTVVLMFLSPVFYPVSAVPDEFKLFILANPSTFIIEQAREVLIWGRLPNWIGLGVYLLVSTLVCWGGFAWFQKTRKGFADVL